MPTTIKDCKYLHRTIARNVVHNIHASLFFRDTANDHLQR